MKSSNRQPRYFFAIGPGDVVKSYQDWLVGQRTAGETSKTFSSECFDYVKEVGANAKFVGYNNRIEKISDGQFELENRPKFAFRKVAGFAFHWREFLYCWSLWLSIMGYRPSALVIDSGTTHWFFLWIVRLCGVKVVPNFHNVYYPVTRPPQGLKKLISKLDGMFFRFGTDFAIGVSPECGYQFQKLAGSAKKFHTYYAQFEPADFVGIPEPVWPTKTEPFRILFVGRVEHNKGVLDLLEVANLLCSQSSKPFLINVCGDGSYLESLRVAIEQQELTEFVIAHGRLQRAELLPFYAKSHVLIVPTRSSFTEGLPLVSIEAVLSHRPVITSRLSNALEILGDAISEAQPDNPRSYAEALLQLMLDKEQYTNKVEATRNVGARFIDPRNGLRHCLKASLQ